MTDHTQLRKLASASLVKGEELAVMSVAEFSQNAELRLAFPSAANPQAVIELLDEIARLTVHLKKAIDQAEHFEREWYLRGDEIERLKKDAERSRWLRHGDNDELVLCNGPSNILRKDINET